MPAGTQTGGFVVPLFVVAVWRKNAGVQGTQTMADDDFCFVRIYRVEQHEARQINIGMTARYS